VLVSFGAQVKIECTA